MRDALSFFQSLDLDRAGIISRKEFALQMHLSKDDPKVREREFFIDNLLVRIHFIIVMIRWPGLAPWEFWIPFSR